MYTLSISDGHNASVALSHNGKVIFAISEERLTRRKNFFGWPANSLDYIDQQYISLSEVGNVVLYREDVTDYLVFLLPEHIKNKLLKKAWKASISRLSLRLRKFCNNNLFKKLLIKYYAQKLNIDAHKILLLNHHKSHAYAAFSEIDINTKDWLHFVLDAEGDGISTSVLHYKKGELNFLNSNDRSNSFGHFYAQITSYLGMKPNQHEFKVMGLEPYADRNSNGFKSCHKKFCDLISVTDGKIKFKVNPTSKKFRKYLVNNFIGERFDYIAAAAQVILEERVLEYVNYWMKKNKIYNISMSGGVAMNVKLMQRLYECQEVKEIYVVPSSGDESCVLGCSNYLALKHNKILECLDNLYLGVHRDLDFEVKSLKDSRPDLHIEYYESIEEEVAKLLHAGNVVARVSGRDEFGARALGNRSILANPNNPEVIDLINKQVKNRDFWMPFTPSILYEEKDNLVINPKQYDARYMNITFNSTEYAKKVMPAALHPWDKTVRPQFVDQQQNPSYHKLINKFYQLSNVPGVLNTSFNLHGDPNVSSAADALDALEKSGLVYLQINNYIIQKN